jgi:hydrogenase nickel incorporation protein HypA/HybF
MHEYGLMEDVLARATEEARRQNAEAVTRVRLDVGQLSAVSTEALTIAFQALSGGTFFQGATLDIAEIPGVFRCDACGFRGPLGEDEAASPPWVCPDCGSLLAVLEGKGIVIREMAVRCRHPDSQTASE